jgi:hypothetical protein
VRDPRPAGVPAGSPGPLPASDASPPASTPRDVADHPEGRHLGRWLGSYLIQATTRRVRRRRRTGRVHLLLCIADHYEPWWGNPAADRAHRRVGRWVEDYPRLLGGFRDADGRPPRHTFFYPLEDYVPEHLDALAGLCRDGFGEVEVHLHHDRETGESLRRRLDAYKELLAARHGLLARDKATGALAYGFVHGNWALDNARPDGRWCGVNDELDILRETGCYADFTLPSAPSATQTRKINSIYYATDDPERPLSHDRGLDVGAGPRPAKSLLLIQGPLLPDWGNRKWGLVPRVENGCLQASQPPTDRRIDLWLRAGVQVVGRPDWSFVKLHTHGAIESNRRMLLGEPTIAFHHALARRAARNPGFCFHYVTAREMVNLVHAAEAGWSGSVEDARDAHLLWEGDIRGRVAVESQGHPDRGVPHERAREGQPA